MTQLDPDGDKAGELQEPDQVEAVRRRLTAVLTQDAATSTDPDAWEQTTVPHLGQATRNRSPGELVTGLYPGTGL
jgi:hypothetical protein